MILLRQKTFSVGRKRAAQKTIKNAKLIKETWPEIYKDWSLEEIIRSQNLNRYSAEANMTTQNNPLAVARFIKKNGRKPEVGEMLEERVKRYKGRIWPESGNHTNNEAKGKKALKQEIKKQLQEAGKQ